MSTLSRFERFRNRDFNYPEVGGTRADTLPSGWLTDFVTTVHDQTGRWPVVYTTRGWWGHCTGGDTTVPARSPLWISPVASDAGGPPGMPAGWGLYTFYQWAKSGTFPGDQDVFNGTAAELAAFAAEHTT